MKTASWVLLTIVGTLVTLIGLVSATLAYSSRSYDVGQTKIEAIGAAHPGVEKALRGIRGTSAAYGVGYGLLFLFIASGPYRRGESWAWYALATALLAILILHALRIPTLGTQLGVAGAVVQAVLGGLGLLLDAGRLRRASTSP